MATHPIGESKHPSICVSSVLVPLTDRTAIAASGEVEPQLPAHTLNRLPVLASRSNVEPSNRTGPRARRYRWVQSCASGSSDVDWTVAATTTIMSWRGQSASYSSEPSAQSPASGCRERDRRRTSETVLDRVVALGVLLRRCGLRAARTGYGRASRTPLAPLPAPLLHVLCFRLRPGRPDRRLLGVPGDPHLRRAPDRMRGGPDAPGGARRDVAGARDPRPCPLELGNDPGHQGCG
jgi:hypothetical protein